MKGAGLRQSQSASHHGAISASAWRNAAVVRSLVEHVRPASQIGCNREWSVTDIVGVVAVAIGGVPHLSD
jgi:hypothetical protein